jgi:hypothetical protein
MYILSEEEMIDFGWTKEQLDEIEEAQTTGPPEPLFLRAFANTKNLFEEFEKHEGYGKLKG